MLFSCGHESWSETFFGSANDPPPPSPLACMSLELWILPWGMRKLVQVSPEPPPPLNLFKIFYKNWRRRNLWKIYCDPWLNYWYRMFLVIPYPRSTPYKNFLINKKHNTLNFNLEPKPILFAGNALTQLFISIAKYIHVKELQEAFKLFNTYRNAELQNCNIIPVFGNTGDPTIFKSPKHSKTSSLTKQHPFLEASITSRPMGHPYTF